MIQRDPAFAGVHTFLIADIRDYSRFAEHHGDEAAARLIAQFADVVEETVTRRHGHVTELRGDEALAVFPSARQALRASVELQRYFSGWDDQGPSQSLPVGIGLDAGEAVPVKGGYRGRALNLAARLCSVARPNEVFASPGVTHLAGIVHGLVYVDRGKVSLKGLSDPVHVFQIVSTDEAGRSLPPLQQMHSSPTHHLADEPTRFVGRQRELAELQALIRTPSVRLITLTGPGGTGKSRLAVRLADSVKEDFTDGVHFISLGPIGDAGIVASAIASTFGLGDEPGQELLETLCSHLRDSAALLVLDGFEHVLQAHTLVTELLRACRRVKVLVTSQTLLHLSREHVYEVPPLAVPTSEPHGPSQEIIQHEAVALFVDRARAATASFTLTDKDASVIAEICRQLDGLPLAIELAAARIRLFPPEELLLRLGSRLTILTGGPRDAPLKHQTLRSAIEWSFQLLSSREQSLFSQLAVFAGGSTLEAVEAVCSDVETNLLDGISSLIEKSLLRQEEVGGESRFRMLQTIQEYASLLLEQNGQAETAHRHHAEYYLSIAEKPELTGSDQVLWLERLEREADNLRAALTWAFAHDEEIALRLAAALARFWERRSAFGEGRMWLERGLAITGSSAPETRRKLYGWATYMALRLGDNVQAERWNRQYMALSRELGHAAGSAWALHNMAMSALARDELEKAAEQLQESKLLFRHIGDKRGEAANLNSLALIALSRKDYGRADALLKESMALSRQLADPLYLAATLELRGSLQFEEGDQAQAKESWSQSLRLSHEIGDRRGMAYCLEGLAALAGTKGQTERAARLYAYAEELRTSIHTPHQPWDRVRRVHWLSLARSQSGESGWSEAWRRGKAMSLEDAVAYSLEENSV